MGPWTLEFLSSKNHVTELVIKDENGDPIDLDGWFLSVEIEHNDGTAVYSTDTGHFTIAAPTTDGKAILAVPKAEIADLPFEWAAFTLNAGPDEDSAETYYEGKAHRK